MIHADTMPIRALRPAELTTGPFTVATARRAGVTHRMLQGNGWRQLLRGVYADSDLVVTDQVRLAALQLAMPPDAVATRLSAAWLHGVWQPPPGKPVPLHFATALDRARPAGQAAFSHRATWWEDDIVTVQGVLVTAAMRTAFELARRACLVEAVVVIDAFAYAGLIELPWFWAYLNCHRRWPGVQRVREATELASDRARSGGESRVRMIPVLGGLPEPLVNPPIYRDGILVAYLDLLLQARGKDVGVEYDGAYHEDESQHHRDNRRENGLVGTGGFPLLRYDRFTVVRHDERVRALHQMGRAIGLDPPNVLNPLWFADARRPLRW